MTEFIRTDKSQKADVLDFINYVFSNAHCPHDFKTLIPKVYADEKEEFRGTHYAAVEEGKIKAVITDLIMEEQVGSEIFKYGMIGNVSVHPYARGEGYMKALMKMAKEDAQNEGVDVMVLGGQRQRYGYFGFESAGVNYRFLITKTNIRHCMKQVECQDIVFENVEDADAQEIAAAKALYEKRPAHAIRPKEDFLAIMHNWASSFYAIKKEGRMIGYIYANADEVVLEDESDLPAVLKAWFAQKGVNEVNMTAWPFEKERISYLASICEHMSVVPGEMICVLNWEKVLQTLLQFKDRYCPLQDGEVSLCIEEEAFHIIVNNGNVSVKKLDERNQEILKFTHNEAEMLFFGLQNLLIAPAEFKNWLPLPFFIDKPDAF
ncbi:MAG: GNAT family N-acetyltransferase [Lachnospiraceae bacterium]|nr:GNAT family N-acetyltransferase [Lachnospiraceae bacterium]